MSRSMTFFDHFTPFRQFIFFFFVLEEGGDNSFDRRRRRRDGRGSSFSKSNRGTRKDSLQHMELGTWDKAKEKIINS